MARNVIPWLFGLGAFVIGAFAVGVVAAALGPLREFLVQKCVEHGINPPRSLIPQPIVIDNDRSIKYIGSYSPGVEHFQNIFYAENTAGNNRFRPPVPVKPARGSVIDATKSGAWCPQGTGDIFPFTSRVTNISENCLSLRIARPAGTKPGAKLPVMVWLHGGEFLHLTLQEPWLELGLTPSLDEKVAMLSDQALTFFILLMDLSSKP